MHILVAPLLAVTADGNIAKRELFFCIFVESCYDLSEFVDNMGCCAENQK